MSQAPRKGRHVYGAQKDPRRHHGLEIPAFARHCDALEFWSRWSGLRCPRNSHSKPIRVKSEFENFTMGDAYSIAMF